MKKTQLFTILFVLIISISFPVKSQLISTFEEYNFGLDSVNDGTIHPLGFYFESGSSKFYNYYDTAYGGWWSSGWALSSMRDSTTAGFFNLHSSIAGGGYNSTTYAVGQQEAMIKLQNNVIGRKVLGMYITNSTYSYKSMMMGDGYAKKFGGITGNDMDYFLLSFKKYYNGLLANDSINFYLADYRFMDNSYDYILRNWTWVDLTPLGNVDSLVCTLFSSDVGPYGINTPLFFCIENFTIESSVNINDLENRDFVATVFPNPAKDFINIEVLNNEGFFNIELFDNKGKIVFKDKSYLENYKINFSNLSSGIYNLKIYDDKRIENKKIIVQ